MNSPGLTIFFADPLFISHLMMTTFKKSGGIDGNPGQWAINPLKFTNDRVLHANNLLWLGGP